MSEKKEKVTIWPRVIVAAMQGSLLGGCFMLTEGVYHSYKEGRPIHRLLSAIHMRRAMTMNNLLIAPCVFVVMTLAFDRQ